MVLNFSIDVYKTLQYTHQDTFKYIYPCKVIKACKQAVSRKFKYSINIVLSREAETKYTYSFSGVIGLVIKSWSCKDWKSNAESLHRYCLFTDILWFTDVATTMSSFAIVS